MEIIALIETSKAPFSSTGIIYDEDAGTRPFMCPVFFDNTISDIFYVDPHGVIFGNDFPNLLPETQVVCVVTAFFNYAALCHLTELSTAFDNLKMDPDGGLIQKSVFETTLDYLHRRGQAKWYDKTINIDILSGYANSVDDCIIEQLMSIDNQYISDLMFARTISNSYGFSNMYNRLGELVYTNMDYITFIDFPDTTVVQGKFMNI